MTDNTLQAAPDPDWMDSMLSSALQLTAYDEHRMNTVMVNQFAGQSTQLARLLSESGRAYNLMSLGVDATSRRAAVLRNPMLLVELVESGFGEEGVRLLLGITTQSNMHKWLKTNRLFESYQEALRVSAFALEQGLCELYDARLTPIERHMQDVIAANTDAEDTTYRGYAMGMVSMLGKQHDCTLKHLNAKRSMVMERAARLNPEHFGAAREQANNGGVSRSVAININLGTPANGAVRSVDPSVIEGCAVDTTTNRVVQSFGVSLNTTPPEDSQ